MAVKMPSVAVKPSSVKVKAPAKGPKQKPATKGKDKALGPVAEKPPKGKRASEPKERGHRTIGPLYKIAQVRILRCLKRCKSPITLPKLNEAVAEVGDFPTAEKFIQWMADPMGAVNPANRVEAEARAGYPSLLTMGFVKQSRITILEKETYGYSITDKGKAALEAAEKFLKEKAKLAK